MCLNGREAAGGLKTEYKAATGSWKRGWGVENGWRNGQSLGVVVGSRGWGHQAHACGR